MEAIVERRARHRSTRLGGPLRPARMRRLLRSGGTVVASGLLILVGGLLVATVAVPIVTGADTYAVLTRSMEPGLPPGALVVVRPVATDELHTGDVVTFQPSPGRPDVVTHRIVRVEAGADGAKRYVTRGDENAVADAAPVRPEQIRGRVWYAVPAAGWLAVLRNSTSLRPWLAGIGAMLTLYALVWISSWLHRRRQGAAEVPQAHRETFIPL